MGYVASTYTFPIYSFRIVQSWNINLALLDEPIICEHDASDGSHEHSICGHKVEECLGVGENDPWYHCPASDKHGEDDTATDIKVFREERCDI